MTDVCSHSCFQAAMGGDGRAMEKFGQLLIAGHGAKQDRHDAAAWSQEAWYVDNSGGFNLSEIYDRMPSSAPLPGLFKTSKRQMLWEARIVPARSVAHPCRQPRRAVAGASMMGTAPKRRSPLRKRAGAVTRARAVPGLVSDPGLEAHPYPLGCGTIGGQAWSSWRAKVAHR